MATYTTRSNKFVNTDKEIGRGGEGSVFTLAGIKEFVAKIYHPSLCNPEIESKLSIMLKNPPSDDTRRLNPPHISITWPVELLYHKRRFAGYIMPYINKCPDLYKIFSPVLRRNYYPSFDHRYLHRIGRNIAAALNALHSKGYVIGDINQKNILVTDRAMVTFIDIDSVQVPDHNGQMFRCSVGVPEYTPPELQGIPINKINRTPFQDYFGLAVLIFQLLMQGYHPFSGTPIDTSESIQSELYLKCIIEGIFPYYKNRIFNPPPFAPKFDILYPDLQRLFIRCFIQGYQYPSYRPTAYDWIKALDKAEHSLIQCSHNRSHWFSNHLDICPWCSKRIKRKTHVRKKRRQKAKPAYTVKQRSIAIKGIRFLVNYIPSGKFIMGSPPGESPHRKRDEKIHKVTISEGFWMMETPVTRDIFLNISGFDPCPFSSQNSMKHPVINVSWMEAMDFCRKLSSLLGVQCGLPTEAEWEYACRAGTSTPYHFGNNINKNHANYDKSAVKPDPVRILIDSQVETSEVKTYKPNALGLYDMHGNVWEWCADWYGKYESGTSVDPKGPQTPKKQRLKIIRGGSYTSSLHELRSSCRRSSLQYKGNYITGFRIVIRNF